MCICGAPETIHFAVYRCCGPVDGRVINALSQERLVKNLYWVSMGTFITYSQTMPFEIQKALLIVKLHLHVLCT